MKKSKPNVVKGWVAISRATQSKGKLMTVASNKDDIEGLLYMFCDVFPCEITYFERVAKAAKKGGKG